MLLLESKRELYLIMSFMPRQILEVVRCDLPFIASLFSSFMETRKFTICWLPILCMIKMPMDNHSFSKLLYYL